MNNIFKATLLLLCAVAWARAAALPASTPCPLDRNVTPNSLVQYRQMEDTFLSILNDTRHLRDRAQVYFKNTGVPNECFMVDTGIGEPTMIDLNRDVLAQLVQYYYSLTRFAFHTGVSLNEEEQLELKLQPSFYQQLRTIKGKLLKGTIQLRIELVARGYGCVEDLHTNSTEQPEIPAVCPTRYIGLVKVIADLNTAAAHVESLTRIFSQQLQKKD